LKLKKKKAIRFFVALGIVLLSVGVLFFDWTLKLHAIEGRIVTNIALVSMFSILFGITTLTVGLTLFVVTKTNQK